jgi:hypothetical protein
MKNYVDEDTIVGPRFRVNIGKENHPPAVAYTRLQINNLCL